MGETQGLPMGIFDAVRRSALFAEIEDAVLREVSGEFELLTLKAGEYLFYEGDRGDSLYIVGRGIVRVTRAAKDGSQLVIAEHGVGACVGEIALITGQPRTASVSAVTEVELVRLSNRGFAQIAERYPYLARLLTVAIVPRMQASHLAHIFDDLFGGIEPAALKALQAELTWQELRSGERLFKQGDPGDAMYVLVNGRLQIAFTEEDGSERVLGEIGVGETVGEMALLVGEPRSASVYALRDSNVVKLPTRLFERLMDERPQLIGQITRTIIRRQQRLMTGKTDPRSYNYALIPLSRDLAMGDFVRELAAEMAKFGSTIALDAAQFDAAYGVEGASRLGLDHPLDLAIDNWLCDIDFRYQHVMLVGDPDNSTWTERCLAQADRVIFVASSNDGHAPRPVERLITERFSKVRAELVLVHPPETELPRGTVEWLRPRKVERYYHARRGDAQHMRRLARFLTGNAVGLALSGGGARGYAHVGAIRALLEAGIEIDAIAGTSIGSVVAGAYALHQTVDALYDLARRFASRAAIFDYTLPFVAINRTAKLNATMRAIYGDHYIEDLWIPYFCVATNLTRATPLINRQGMLRQAIRGSLAIPAVFTPILVDGDLVVDGGVMNNFPVDLMREFVESGMVIGSAVSPARERVNKPFEIEDEVSGWGVLFSRLTGRKKRVPALTKTVLRALEVNSVYRVRTYEHVVDLLIRPDASKYSILEFDASAPLFEIGYNETQEKLKDWLPVYRARYG